MRNTHSKKSSVGILSALCVSLILGAGSVSVFAGDDDHGSGQPPSGYPQSGPPSGGPPMAGQSCSGNAGDSADFGDSAHLPDPSAAMAELRKTDPALADKMEKLMQDAKAIAEEAARKK